MELEKLYSIDKRGKVRVFYCQYDEYSIVTLTGLIDGKLISKSTSILHGKQGRNRAQQVEFEAKSLWRAKINEGYKSWQMLLKKLATVRDIYTTENATNVIAIYKEVAIKFNTNGNWHNLPMLAEKWKDKKKKATYPLIVQPKLNGVRCLAFWDEKIQDVRLMSRGGEYYKVPHISSTLHEFLKTNFSITLDGEIYNHGVPLQEISGAVRTEDEITLFGSEKQDFLEYWVYDIADTFMHQQNRHNLLYKELDFTNLSKVFKLESHFATHEEDVINLHNEFVAKGYEGAITRECFGFYEASFRSSNLLKVKEFIDEEFEIIGYKIDESKSIGESFVFELENNQGKMIAGGKQTFYARPTGTAEQKEKWYNNIDFYIGQRATIRFQERSKDGLPIQAHVRHKDSPVLLIENVRRNTE